MWDKPKFCIDCSSPQPGSAAHLALVREAANFKLKYGRKKEAISDLEQLWKWVTAENSELREVLRAHAALRWTTTFVPFHRQNTKDVHTLAQLISAYSLVDTDKAKSYPFMHFTHKKPQTLYKSFKWIKHFWGCKEFLSQCHISLAFRSSLSKHLPSADTMALKIDVDELENSHGATYVRKKAAKVTGENPPKEPG